MLFINLGFWQIRRAAWKVQLLKEQAERKAQPPRPLAKVPQAPAAANHIPVKLTGRYQTSHIFLLDNRVLNSKVGFEVLVPFEDKSVGRDVLVDRGFVPMGPTRQTMPRIPPMTPHADTALGQVYVGDKEAATPAHETTSLRPGVDIVEVASPALISRILGKPFYPHVVRLAKSDPNALPRYWPVTMMMPSRHRAYAVQWFLMAIAVLGAWGAFSFKREQPTEEP